MASPIKVDLGRGEGAVWFEAVEVPAERSAGRASGVVAQGGVGDDWVQMDAPPNAQYRVQGGFSGAPLFEPATARSFTPARCPTGALARASSMSARKSAPARTSPWARLAASACAGARARRPRSPVGADAFVTVCRSHKHAAGVNLAFAGCVGQ